MRGKLLVVAFLVSLQILGGGAMPAAGTGTRNDLVAARSSSTAATGPGVGWQEFAWGSDGLPFESFVFTTERSRRVTLTDILCAGDEFAIFDGGRLLRASSAVPTDFNCNPIVEDPDLAYRNPIYSHASFVLRPGTHELEVRATSNPFGGGGGFIRFDFPPRRLR